MISIPPNRMKDIFTRRTIKINLISYFYGLNYNHYDNIATLVSNCSNDRNRSLYLSDCSRAIRNDCKKGKKRA